MLCEYFWCLIVQKCSASLKTIFMFKKFKLIYLTFNIKTT